MANLGPQIQSVSPNIGSQTGGTSVVITGVNFQDGIGSVQFGSVAAPNFTVNSDTQITAVSPAQGIGNVSVGILSPGDATVYGTTATFTYTQGLPISNTMTQVSSAAASHTSIHIWGVDAATNIWQYTGSGTNWTQISGVMDQVSVAADGTVWGVQHHNNVIYKYNGNNTWTQISGCLSQVAVGSTSIIWGVDYEHQIWQYHGSGWTQMNGRLSQIAVASDGTVWGVGSSGGLVFQYAGNNVWNQIPTNVVAGGPNIPFTQLTVVDVYLIWGLDAQGNSYEYTAPGAPWQKIGLPPARVLSYNADTSCVLIDSQGITQFFAGSNQ